MSNRIFKFQPLHLLFGLGLLSVAATPGNKHIIKPSNASHTCQSRLES